MQLGHKESDILDVVSHFHKLIGFRVEDWPEKTKTITDALFTLGYTPQKFLHEMMQPCNKMLKKCLWYDRVTPCDTLFYVTKSSRGFCCSFNSAIAMKFNK